MLFLNIFIAYFDYSIGVPEKVKEEAKQALADAQVEDVPVENETFEVQVVEEPKTIDFGFIKAIKSSRFFGSFLFFHIFYY